MKATISQPTGMYKLDRANSIAEQLQKGDPDLVYAVVDCKNGLGRIDVYELDGELVQKAFLPVY